MAEHGDGSNQVVVFLRLAARNTMVGSVSSRAQRSSRKMASMVAAATMVNGGQRWPFVKLFGGFSSCHQGESIGGVGSSKQ